MYIVFEGIDNSGKTTQLELVRERLEILMKINCINFPLITLAEPELNPDDVVDKNDNIELALRFALQRRLLLKEHLDDLAHNSPSIVLSDRSYYSSMAYQGEWVKHLNNHVPKPSMIFFFDAGKPEDESLTVVYNNYFNVLPLSTIYVNTKNYSLTNTTNYIVGKILGKWNRLFQGAKKLNGI